MKNSIIKGSTEKGTIYRLFYVDLVPGIIKVEARDIEWSIGELAQFSNGIIISCLPKRKRLKRLIESIETEIVIFKGWGHIDPPSLLETYGPKIEGIGSVTTWTLDMDSYNKNVEKFNEFINNYLKSNSSHLEVDFREHQLKRRN